MFVFLVPVIVFRFRRGVAQNIRVLAENAEEAWLAIGEKIEKAEGKFGAPYWYGLTSNIDNIEMGEPDDVELLGSFNRVACGPISHPLVKLESRS